jgi:hypothetical protein
MGYGRILKRHRRRFAQVAAHFALSTAACTIKAEMRPSYTVGRHWAIVGPGEFPLCWSASFHR